MNKLFGKAKQAPPASDSIQKLRETLDMLEKREKYLEKKIVTELDQARKLASTKNRRGMHRTPYTKQIKIVWFAKFQFFANFPSISLHYSECALFGPI